MSISQSTLDQWAQEDAHSDNVKGAERAFPSFDGRVQHIIQHYTATVNKDFINGFQSRTENLQNEFTDIAGRLFGDPKTYVLETENHSHAAISKVERQLAPKITDLQRDLLGWKARFKSGFYNDIENPKKQNFAWHWGIILFLFAVEVILNSRFFAETSEYGLLGGTMAAIAVSVVNIGIPILAGYFTHKLYFSKSAIPKVSGLFLVVVLVVFVAVFNFLVAEYRDQLLISVGKLPSAPPEYLALLAIGSTIAVISFWKMFSFMDPFLRPRRCHENQQNAVHDYKDTALKPIKDAQAAVSSMRKDLRIQVEKAQKAKQSERDSFEFKCSETIRESNEKIGYYYLKYCPAKIDPDPKMPELREEQYDFSSAQELVSRTLEDLEKSCRKAENEWQPVLEEIEHSLASTHQRFQASVVAHIDAALKKAG